MKFKTLVLALSAVILFAVPAIAATIHVPGDYASIQEAVNAAVAGDTIEVGQGVFEGAVIQTNDLTLKGKGKKTIITAIPQPFGPNGPKAGFFLPDVGGSGTSGVKIEGFGFEPYDPDNAPDDGVSFPVFCRNVSRVVVSHIESARSVQGVTFSSSDNCRADHNNFGGVTTYFGSGGGIGISISGEGNNLEVDHNKVRLVELFDSIGFNPVGISVIAVPAVGSTHGALIHHNDIHALVEPPEGTQGIEVGTHAGYLPAQGPPNTGVCIWDNKIKVQEPSMEIVWREGVDEVSLHNCGNGGDSDENSDKEMLTTVAPSRRTIIDGRILPPKRILFQ
jgi:hypothetical protein